MTLAYIVIGVLLVVVLWWWFIGRNVPKHPPLDVQDDDPRMLRAIEKARASLDSLRELHASQHQEVQVKLPFVSNSGETEYLWAEVLTLGESEMDVRYLTPPVTHTGKLERLHSHPVSDVEDWVVILENGDIHGGYTQRVMFTIAREQYGELPPQLKAQEARYVDQSCR